MRKTLIGIGIGALLMVTGVVLAAPPAQNFTNIQPYITNVYDNGTSTNQWFHTFSKIFLGDDGTVAVPSYSFTSDPDTGLFHAGVNTVGLSGGGSGVQWNGSAFTPSSPNRNLGADLTPWANLFIGKLTTGNWRISTSTLTSNTLLVTNTGYPSVIFGSDDATPIANIELNSVLEGSYASFGIKNDGNEGALTYDTATNVGGITPNLIVNNLTGGGTCLFIKTTPGNGSACLRSYNGLSSIFNVSNPYSASGNEANLSTTIVDANNNTNTLDLGLEDYGGSLPTGRQQYDFALASNSSVPFPTIAKGWWLQSNGNTSNATSSFGYMTASSTQSGTVGTSTVVGLGDMWTNGYSKGGGVAGIDYGVRGVADGTGATLQVVSTTTRTKALEVFKRDGSTFTSLFNVNNSGQIGFSGYLFGTSTATSTIANLGGTLDATAFATSSEIGYPVMLAYASSACSKNGCNIHIPHGVYTQTFPITINTSGRVANIICDAGVTYINWTGAATSTTFDVVESSGREFGMEGCVITGTGSANGQIGLQVGGANNTRETIFTKNTFKSLTKGIALESNSYMVNIIENDFTANQNAIISEGAINAGEQYVITGNQIVDNNNTTSTSLADKCVYFKAGTLASVLLADNTYDNCQVYIGAFARLVTIHGGHAEDPGGGYVGYDYFHVESSQYTTFNVDGLSIFQGVSSGANVPTQFFWFGGSGNYTVSNVGGKGVGGTPPSYFIFNNAAPGNEVISNIGMTDGPYTSLTNSDTNVVLQSGGKLGVATSSPADLFSVTGTSYFAGSIGVGLANPSAGAVEILQTANSAGNGFTALNSGNTASGRYWVDTAGNARLDAGSGGFNSLELNAATVGGGGAVGIGTTSPLALLSIHANANSLHISPMLFAVASSTASATSTLFSIDNQGNITTAMTGTQCVHEVNGLLSGTGSDCGSGGGTFSFTPTSYSGTAVNATSTALWLKGTAPFSLIASSTFFTTASSTNFEMTKYVLDFPGAELGAKFANAYTGSATGTTYMITASTTQSTPINMNSVNRVGTIVCSPGVVINWTGAATSTILNADGVDHNTLLNGWGMRGCTINGVGGAGQVGIQLGGSGGGHGVVIEDNTFTNLNHAIQTEDHTWSLAVRDNFFQSNNRAVWIESSTGDSGEGYDFDHNTFADCNNTLGDCFFSEVNGTDGLQMNANIFDDAGIHLSDGNLSASLVSTKWENPGWATYGRYTYGTFDSGGFMNVTITGGTIMNGAGDLAHSPVQFFLNGAQLNINGLTPDNNTGTTVSVPALVNNYGGGTASISGYKDINSGTKTVAVTATSSTPFFFDANYANGIGALGIGTSTPQADLQAWNTGTNVQAFFTRKDGATLNFKAQDNQDRIVFHSTGGTNDNPLYFDSDDSGTTRMTLLGGGSVGIGTTSPITQFAVEGGSAGITLSRTGAAEPFIQFMSNGVKVSQVRGTTGGGLKFTSGDSNTLWASFSSTGSFGIGTSTPVATFQATPLSGNATTSIQFGKPGQNKGTCITYYDDAGTPVYGHIATGATSFTYTTSKPSGCQN